MEGEESPELVAAWKKERRALWWTFGGLAALSLVWSGHKVLGYIITKRITELLLIGGPLEANRYFNRMVPWIHSSRTVVNVMAFVFLCSLIWWLLATRHRRALHPAGFATRDRQGSKAGDLTQGLIERGRGNDHSDCG